MAVMLSKILPEFRIKCLEDYPWNASIHHFKATRPLSTTNSQPEDQKEEDKRDVRCMNINQISCHQFWSDDPDS